MREGGRGGRGFSELGWVEVVSWVIYRFSLVFIFGVLSSGIDEG